jgi:hypothetical protein
MYCFFRTETKNGIQNAHGYADHQEPDDQVRRESLEFVPRSMGRFLSPRANLVNKQITTLSALLGDANRLLCEANRCLGCVAGRSPTGTPTTLGPTMGPTSSEVAALRSWWSPLPVPPDFASAAAAFDWAEAAADAAEGTSTQRVRDHTHGASCPPIRNQAPRPSPWSTSRG